MDDLEGKTPTEKAAENSHEGPEDPVNSNLMAAKEGTIDGNSHIEEEESPQETLKGILQSPSSYPSHEDNEPHKSNMDALAGEGTDMDESKKEVDTSKAVTFAEDIEVFDCKAATPITVSLDTPVHLIDPILEAEKAAQDNADSSIGPSTPVEESYTSAVLLASSDSDGKSEDEYRLPERSVAARPSLLNLDREPAILASTSDSVCAGEQENKSSMKAASPVDAEEVEGDHKIFSVTVVDESELQLQEDEDEGNQDNVNIGSPDADGVMEKVPSAPSEASSGQSADNNVQDTIGPLENPAFLKTLQYSVR